MRGSLLGSVGSIHLDFIRPFLPKTGYVVRNDVRVGVRKPLDWIWDDRRWHGQPTSKERYKKGNTDCIDHCVQTGDIIVVIGGGYGVTGIRAAEQVGPDGHVHIYEGSREQIKYIKFAVREHGFEDRCTVHHSIVGENIDVYDGMGDPEIVVPGSLPACDVLELDCEGAEFSILHEMDIIPRDIIAEIHNHKFSESASEFLEILCDKGYSIDLRVDQKGVILSEEDFENLLSLDRDKYGNEHPSGWIHPPVVCSSHSGEDFV